jgi:uncharacterized flavoprotein (TIGR03862 family)
LIAVVGGGPAGLMAAEVLAAAGQAVTVFDRMPSLGRKLLIAGRGGLNLTHTEPLDRFLSRYGRARSAIEPAVAAFPPDALRAWCEGLGQPTVVGSSGRVFPQAWKASPLLRAWLQRLGGLGVQVRTGHRWTGWDGDRLRFETAEGVVAVDADAVVLALGGASWPRLGSDGAWVPVLEGAGVPVAPLRAANAGFLCSWSEPFRRFAGEPLKRIAATFGGRTVRGEATITEYGIEGGAIYALSGPLREAIEAHGEATLVLDLRPDLDAAAIAPRLGGGGVSMANALRRAGLSQAAASLVREIPGTRPLAERIKAVPLRLTGVRPIGRAISTAGGVRFAGLNGAMLRARPGVFVAGEMLDWEAPTGGYLLQACFATGRAAGLQALEWLGVG